MIKKAGILLVFNFIVIKLDASEVLSRDLYLDLMKKCLINSIYQDGSLSWEITPQYNSNQRENGQDWPVVAHTMIGLKRLNNIQFCVEDVIAQNIPGDFIETGVWRGGATIFMRAILKAFNDNQRTVWVADSFAGLPIPNTELYPADNGLNLYQRPELAVSLEQVQANFVRYGLLDNQVKFLKGWFKDTLPAAPIKQLAILRLDGDLYESTMDALNNLYSKLSIGGYVIVDDYGIITACKQAIEDFRNKNNINDPILGIDHSGVFWKKTQ